MLVTATQRDRIARAVARLNGVVVLQIVVMLLVFSAIHAPRVILAQLSAYGKYRSQSRPRYSLALALALATLSPANGGRS